MAAVHRAVRGLSAALPRPPAGAGASPGRATSIRWSASWRSSTERIAPGVVGRVEVRGSTVDGAQRRRRHARARPALPRARGDGLTLGGRRRMQPLSEERHGRRTDRHRPARVHALIIVLREDRDRRAAAERVRRRAAGPLLRHARRRLPHPGAVRRRHPLQALAEGVGARHPGADLHHARQRAGAGRRRAVSEGAQPGARVVRHLRLPVRDLAAGADDAAQRGRQDRSRSHVRGAHQHQHRRSSPSSTRRPSRGA